MKNLMIAAIALSAGFAGMTQDASAGHGKARKRAATRRIVGGILDLTLGGRRSRGHWGHGHWDNGHWDHGHGPVIVRPVRRYYVKYHVDGTKRLHFNSHSSAHRMERYLRSLGAHTKLVHLGGHYDIVFDMHGRASRRFYSHSAAHSFERRLERLGFHAKIIH